MNCRPRSTRCVIAGRTTRATCFSSPAGADAGARRPRHDREVALPPVSDADPSRFTCAFGHRRLSIIDLRAAGHQPMATADGRYWVTYNGEIYNYLELRRELEGLGSVFRTASDTEVLLEAYRHWGTGMLPRLVGMFAFAILDLSSARCCSPAIISASSRCIFRGGRGSSRLRPRSRRCCACRESAVAATPGAHTSISLRRARCGASDAFRRGRAAAGRALPRGRPRHDACRGAARFWEIDLDARSSATFPEAEAEVRRLFDASVRLHLRSDVPVGSCLSGGLDSTAIVPEATRALGASGPMHTFSFIADDLRLPRSRTSIS